MENEKLKPMLFTALKGYDGKQFAQDLVSGIIVAIIALPLSIALALPAKWKSYSFRFVYNSSLVLVKVNKGEVLVNIAEGEPVQLVVYNKNYTVTDVPLRITMEEN